MLIFLAGLLVALICLDKSRLDWIEFLQKQSSRRLLAFRDEIRDAVCRGEVEPGKWFDLLDSSITTGVDFLEDSTALEVASVITSNWHRPEIREAMDALYQDIDKPEDLKIKWYWERYQREFVSALRQRHSATFESLCLLGKLTSRIGNTVGNVKAQVRDAVTGAPETSTLLTYYGPRQAA